MFTERGAGADGMIVTGYYSRFEPRGHGQNFVGPNYRNAKFALTTWPKQTTPNRHSRPTMLL